MAPVCKSERRALGGQSGVRGQPVAQGRKKSRAAPAFTAEEVAVGTFEVLKDMAKLKYES